MNRLLSKGRVVSFDGLLAYVPPMRIKTVLRLIMIPYAVLFFPHGYFMHDIFTGFASLLEGEGDFGLFINTLAAMLFLLAIVLCYFTVVEISVQNDRIVARNIYYFKFHLQISSCRLIYSRIWPLMRLSFILFSGNICLPTCFGLIPNEQSLRDLLNIVRDKDKGTQLN